ncbi:MAG: xanthine dehydrogenase accessory protein XdhC [Proteobacteria bacterium]|nr:xanthine dehydrogenase accessory protein XdhC [Pseudomonadota bacterium]
MSRFIREYLAKAQELSSQGVPFVTVTLIQPEGHVPQDIGAKAIISTDGIIWGTVGGGRLEAQAIQHSKAMIEKAELQDVKNPVEPEMVRYDLKKDLNMVCGGMASLFYELSSHRSWNIAVFGAGHVAQAVVPLITSFECNVWCIDPREEWLAKLPSKHNLKKVCSEDLPGYVSKLPKDLFYLCITQGHFTDLPIVREILKRQDALFLGVIGSVQKARTLKNTLREEGFSQEELNSIHCPVGLPIGTNAPGEIAVSIASQLLQKRDELWKEPTEKP